MIARGRRRMVALALLAGIVVLGVGLRALNDATAYQLFGRIVARVETDQPVVALTFDDGPAPERTAEILATLARQEVPATFFVVGEAVAANPAAARAIVAGGHQLANHSWSHQRLIVRSPGFVGAEIDRATAAIRAAGEDGEILFRPPYGDKLLVLPWELHRRGMTTVTWDVAPGADPDAGAEAIVREAVAGVRPGSIVVLHPWYASGSPSRAAIEPLIAALKARGYRFVTVSALLAGETGDESARATIRAGSGSARRRASRAGGRGTRWGADRATAASSGC